MKERPIPFNDSMVRAILAGEKTQTRRLVKEKAALQWIDEGFAPNFIADPENKLCRYGIPGDRLWARETFSVYDYDDSYREIYYRADKADVKISVEDWGSSDGHYTTEKVLWRPSIHMPRSVSRITLEVKNIRLERLQDISYADAVAEGAGFWADENGGRSDAQADFKKLWATVSGQESWHENPYVWVIDFERVE